MQINTVSSWHILQSSMHGSTRNYQIPSLHELHNRTTDPDTVPGMFTAARVLILYTVALTGSFPVAQVYDAGLNRERVFTVRVSQQLWWSELLLAVMVAAGGERCRQT